MKRINGLCLVLVTVACGLGGRGWVQAQATNGAVQAAITNVEDGARVGAEADDASAKATTAEATDEGTQDSKRKRVIHRGPIVVMGRDVELKAGETADAVVVIGASAKIHGKVNDAVVVIGGDLIVDGEVGDAAVAVMGSIKAGKGANIHGEVVSVGGRVDAAEGAIIHESPVEIDPVGLGSGLRKWFVHCVLKLRPLAPQVGWVWIIAGLFFLVYLLVALVLPRPVLACVGELTRRPATTFFLGLLTKLLLPLVIGILAVTGIGLLVVPFILAALMFGAIVGKVALLECMGSGIGGRFGANTLQKPLLAFLIGIILLTLLYMVPIVGLIAFGVVSVWGLGGAVTATFSSLKREMPEKPVAPNPPMAALPGATGGDIPITGAVEPAAQPLGAAVISSIPANMPEALAFPKAGFWQRMAAAFLDMLLIGIVGSAFGHAPIAFLIALAYFVGMWTWKGTTIGGIVLGLKVVRLDGQPVTMTVALVRALAAAFSVIVLFLGILWIAWDSDKQGWHDRIAGTVVVRLPRGTPLVCL